MGAFAGGVPNLVYLHTGNININNPENYQSFFDNLKGSPRDYFINSDKDFELDINLMAPEVVNRFGVYSADIFDNSGKNIYSLNGSSATWQESYDSFIRDYFMKGPELSQQLPAGKYKIEVYSANNQGEYVLGVGKKNNVYSTQTIMNIYWELPMLKMTFTKTSVLQFFLTSYGIGLIGAVGGLLILLALINYFIGLIKAFIKHNEAKTLLLASSFPEMIDEIIKLLQKPSYDVEVAFITTASKPEEDLDYLQKDLEIMKGVGFNVEQIDIEGKSEGQLMKLLELKDIIFVEGGNTYYLLKAINECKFEKVLRKLLKSGKVYIGVSAGSMVAGKTIMTSVWRGEVNGKNKNRVKLKKLKGMNLVPFDIFVHYETKYAEIIKRKMKNPKKRFKKLRILTDGQALLVQGKEIDLIGDGEAVII